jgi:hypothetical protein
MAFDAMGADYTKTAIYLMQMIQRHSLRDSKQPPFSERDLGWRKVAAIAVFMTMR